MSIDADDNALATLLASSARLQSSFSERFQLSLPAFISLFILVLTIGYPAAA
jgi:hypothetical protein